jgi:hypothetical protein
MFLAASSGFGRRGIVAPPAIDIIGVDQTMLIMVDAFDNVVKQ